jgi:AAA domain
VPFYDGYVLTEAEWWLKPFVLKNEVSGLVGEPGVGKDILLCDWAARATRGWPVPPWAPEDALAPEGELPGYVILATPEDKPTDTIGWRLQSAGADMGLVYDLNKVQRKKAQAGLQRSRFSIPGDLGHLKHVIMSINSGIDPDTGRELETKAPVQMVIIGPLASVATESIAHNQTVRQKIIDPMQELAEECGVALILVMHFNRGSHSKSTPLLERINGSMAGIVGALRVVSAIMPDDVNPDLRRVMFAKNNLAKAHDPENTVLEYIIHGGDNDPHVRYRLPVPEANSASYDVLEARILAELCAARRPVGSQEIAAYMQLAHGIVKQILTKAVREGRAERHRGAYQIKALPGRVEP